MNKRILLLVFLVNVSKLFSQTITPDPNFTPSVYHLSGFIPVVNSMAISDDEKILVVGTFEVVNGTSVGKIIKLNEDGTVDTSFNSGTGFNTKPASISLQSDGKAIIAGDFGYYNGVYRRGLVRINVDGTMDNSFNNGSGFVSPEEVRKTAIQNDGKIIAVGDFTTFNGDYNKDIVRINSDGSTDLSFNSGSGFNNYSGNAVVSSILLQSDGKIVVGGTFELFNGIYQYRIARIKTDGSLDTTFNTNNGFANNNATLAFGVTDIAQQTDNKLVVCGFFEYSGGVKKTIVRLHEDGTLDNSFNLEGTGLNGIPKTIAIQNDGKILVGGEFTEYNGTSRNNLLRLNSDGSLDTSFDPGLGFNNFVQKIIVQDNSTFLVGGKFSLFDTGTFTGQVSRLVEDGNISQLNEIKNSSNLKIHPNPTSSQFCIQTPNEEPINAIRITNSLGQAVMQLNNLNQSTVNIDLNEKPGVYFVEVTFNGEKNTSRVILN